MSTRTDGATPPLVTIGISTYNRVDGTFPDALRSALAQSYEHLEVVVCDNASEDGTQAFVEAIHDPRLRYVRHAVNIGANGNFNACLEAAQGRYFLLLHDDDLLEPGFVENAVAAIGALTPGVALGGVRVIDGHGRTITVADAPEAHAEGAALFLDWFGRRCSFYFCSTLFDTERLRRHGGFTSPADLFQDVAAIARLTAEAGYVAVPGVAGSFRRHDANRGGASHASRWLLDATFLLELLEASFPNDAARLRRHGAPYLAQKCYRYVAGEPSLLGRVRSYRAIDRAFGGAYAPWRYLLRAQGQRLRRLAARWRRRFRGGDAVASAGVPNDGR